MATVDGSYRTPMDTGEDHITTPIPKGTKRKPEGTEEPVSARTRRGAAKILKPGEEIATERAPKRVKREAIQPSPEDIPMEEELIVKQAKKAAKAPAKVKVAKTAAPEKVKTAKAAKPEPTIGETAHVISETPLGSGTYKPQISIMAAPAVPLEDLDMPDAGDERLELDTLATPEPIATKPAVRLDQVIPVQKLSIGGRSFTLKLVGRHLTITFSDARRSSDAPPDTPRKDIMNLLDNIRNYMNTEYSVSPSHDQKINGSQLRKLLLSMKTKIEGSKELKDDVKLNQEIDERLKEIDTVLEQLKTSEKAAAATKQASKKGDKREVSKNLITKLQRAGEKALQIYKGIKTKRAMPMKAVYHSEVLDSEHRYGHRLSDFWGAWADSESTDDFETWLKRVAAGETVPGLSNELGITQLSTISKIHYLDKDQRQAYEMQVSKDGLVSTKQNGLLDSANIPPKTEYMFVIGPDDKMYLGIKTAGWNHSSFFSGAPVQAAGLLDVEKGKIVQIKNWSGHYQPENESMVLTLKTLQAKGVDLEGVAIDLVPGKLKAIDFLAMIAKFG